MITETRPLYEFGPFRLDPVERLFLKGDAPVSLTPKAFEMLTLLVERSGRLVEKEELLQILWPDSFIEESNLSHNIYLIRKALADSSDDRPYIETVPRRGYRFVESVRRIEAPHEGPEEITRHHTRAQIVIEEELPDFKESQVPATAQPTPGPPAVRARILRVCAVAVLSILTAVASSYIYMRNRVPGRAGIGPAAGTLAVLPFKSAGAENDAEILGLGMADSLVNKLSGLRQVSVLPTNSVFKYSGRDYDPIAAGREIGADAVLGGTLQRAGDRVRVTVQLISVGDGRIIWSRQFDKKFTSMFELEDDISDQVAESLLPHITGEEQRRLTKRFTLNPEAEQLYVMGVYYWNRRTEEGVGKAIEYFNRAIDKDPNYAMAYAMLGDCYYLVKYYHHSTAPPEEAMQKAKTAAYKALALDDSLAEAHALMAVVKLSEKDLHSAGEEYRRAISLNPNFATARQRYAWYCLINGQYEEGLRQMRKAQALDPLSSQVSAAMAQILMLGGQLDEALAYGQRAAEFNRDNSSAYLYLGEIYVQKGMYEEAMKAFSRSHEITKDDGARLGGFGRVYAASGRREQAQKILKKLEAMAGRGEANPYDIALIYNTLGQSDRAFEWLQKTLDNKVYFHIILLRYDRNLAGLRSDPRFTDLLKRNNIDLTSAPSSD
jgi:DNA-binding winged helix-turn-helix (wHTH) protein/TolB-like protein/Tfp pilus assembly protein PilF